MKKILVILMLTLLVSSAYAASNPWDQKLPFKNATISYKLNGSFKGTSTLYIKDHGQTRAEYVDSEMKILGISNKRKEITITTPDWVYVYNEKDGVINKQTNPVKYMKEEYEKLSASDKKKLVKNMEETGISTVESLNGTVEKGSAEIMGYKCDKVTMAGITTYTMTGTDIVLKTEGGLMGMKENTEAVSIDKGKPANDKFELPSGVEIVYSAEADAISKEHARSAVQMLLESEGKPMMSISNSGAHEQAAEEDGGFDMDEQKEKLKSMMKMFGGQQ
jgi:hypothetical protein